MLTSASELISDIRTGGSLGCSDHALVEVTVLGDMGKARSIVRTLNFGKANFQLFKDLVSRTPRETVLRHRGQNIAGRTLSMLSIEPRSSQSPGVRSSGKEGKRPAWLS